ncbi:MAG: hypothetical protein ACI9H1_001676 [Polaribacter sp.]|jgi:hypothetical protein|tara:strand:- start:181 stop:726 length:546 start_codon:yes stop_codon:yes gene_type:complete
MKNIKRLTYILAFILFGCSNDDSIISNGFKINGNFYETNYAAIGGGSSSHGLKFFSNFEIGYIASFALYSGDTSGNGELIAGTYTANKSPTSLFGIDGYDYIQFRDNTNSKKLAASPGWYNDSTFQSGSVTINSITSELNENGYYIVTEIDIDYQFRIDETNVVGSYNGPVQFSSLSDVPN